MFQNYVRPIIFIYPISVICVTFANYAYLWKCRPLHGWCIFASSLFVIPTLLFGVFLEMYKMHIFLLCQIVFVKYYFYILVFFKILFNRLSLFTLFPPVLHFYANAGHYTVLSARVLGKECHALKLFWVHMRHQTGCALHKASALLQRPLHMASSGR